MANWKKFLIIKNNNEGVTLISVLVMVIIMFIIASIAVTAGINIINSSKNSQKEEKLATVKSAINKVVLKEGIAGTIAPADSEIYGKPIEVIFDNEEEPKEDWYMLEKEDLEELGVNDVDEKYIVNYKENKVYALEDFEGTIIEGERAKVYMVYFHPDDESQVLGSMTPQKFTYGVSQKLKANTYKKEGYFFKSWNTSIDGSGTSYSNKQSVINLTNENNGIVNLYTVWTTKMLATISYETTNVVKQKGDKKFTNKLTNTGDGNVIYSSSDTSVATINSSTGEVRIVGAGQATITATVTDGLKYAYETSTATYDLIVGKQAVNAITNMDITPEGIVTWVASDNATEYEISIDNINWTSATNGIDYNSTITAEKGDRTVYVRAVNNNSTDYETSSTLSKTVTVYSLELNKETGISNVSGAGRYINGRTVSIDATVSTGYTWKEWVNTSGSTPASNTTKNTTVTVREDTSINATAIPNEYNVTLNNQNATNAGTTSVKAIFASPMPNITVPSKTDYIFRGYYTAINGEGTRYYTETGESAKDWDIASETTLYAFWAVAKIDNRYYTTLQSAVDAAQNGQTIELLVNRVEGVNIPNGKNIIINLNGKTLSHNLGFATIYNNGTVKILNGTITHTSANAHEILNYGDLTLEDVNVKL